jgi:hypothetical protein
MLRRWTRAETRRRLATGCLVVLASLPGAGHAEGSKVWSFKPTVGFVDDSMAFGDNDQRFVYLHTDSAQFLTITVMQTQGFKKEAEIKVDNPNRVPKQIAFTPEANLVLVWMDGHSGQHGAILFDRATGKELKSVGPATAAAITEWKGEPCVSLLTTKADSKGNTLHHVSAYRTGDFKRLGTGSVTVLADQTVKPPSMRLVNWEPGALHVVGMMKGKYDKKRDIRLPERAVRYALLDRKEVWSEEPKDLMPWTRAINMRPNHPGQFRFLQVSDDLKSLLFVDRNNDLGRVTLPVKWSLYEPKSLEQSESWDGKTLFFSMTIDPVNPDAVRRKKADKERVDLYRLDPGPKATPLGEVYTHGRKFHWVASGRYFAYLRKLKGFGRGGNEVEIHRVTP